METTKTRTGRRSKTALIFGITHDYAFALANTLLGLKKHSPGLLEHNIVYHDGLDALDQSALSEIAPCKFVKYEPPFKGDLKVKASAMAMYSLNMFARYEGFRLLDEYDTVLWSDVDVLICDDISALTKPGFVNGIGLCPSMREYSLGDCFFKPVPGVDMKTPLFNSGLMILNQQLKKYREIYDWLNNATVKYSEYLKWPDMGILNLMLLEFGIIPTVLSLEKYQRQPYFDNDGSAAIVHAYGPQKFWNHPDWYCKYPEWIANNKKWIELRKPYFSRDERPIVSVIMPTLNAEKYLGEALESILAQTLIEQEVIIVDGGSDDATIPIGKSYNDHRLRIIDGVEGRGISASLNAGIRVARGEYIARMDADDIALPERLRRQYEYLRAHPGISACGTSVQSFQNATGLWDMVDDSRMLECNLLFSTPFVHPSMMWRAKDFLRHNLFYDENLPANEDFDLWQRASEFLKFGNVKLPLLRYRIHGENAHLKEKTRDTQLVLMNRAFQQFGVSFSKHALLLLDQRDNTCFMSPKAVKKAFNEVCDGFRAVLRRNMRFDKRALAWYLLSHCRWIYFGRVKPLIKHSLNFAQTSLYLATAAKAWVYFDPTEGFTGYKTAMRRYWGIFRASPTTFARKAVRKVWNIQ